mgnify:CR=1 FL=1
MYFCLRGRGVNRNEDAQVTDIPDKRAPVINRQVHAQADPDREARAKAPRSGPHMQLFVSVFTYVFTYIQIPK